MIDTAMILAAGKGTRMQSAPDDPPKPLTEIAGQSLLMRMVARLEASGIKKIIINLHHKAAHIERAMATYEGACEIIFSDERAALLETGGGVKKALPLLGAKPFLVANGDVLWRETDNANAALPAFLAAFKAAQMQALLMLCPTQKTTGYDGAGDYDRRADGQLTRRAQTPKGATAPCVFAGVQILTPALFDALPEGAFSLNLAYDAAAEKHALYGYELNGQWMHVGTPAGRAAAEELMISS
jgi:MurNAc alpha-1-phosphate uridylyltransferase